MCGRKSEDTFRGQGTVHHGEQKEESDCGLSSILYTKVLGFCVLFPLGILSNEDAKSQVSQRKEALMVR